MLQENQKELSHENTKTLDLSSKSKSNISINDIESQKEVQFEEQIKKPAAHNWSWYLKKVVKAGVALLGTAAAIGGVFQVAKTFRKGQKSGSELSAFGDGYRNGITPSDINTTNIGINSTNNYLDKARNELGDLVNITKDDAAKINETVGYVETPVFVGHANRIKGLIPPGPKTFPSGFDVRYFNGVNIFKIDEVTGGQNFHLGFFVSTAGDINGDGIGDFAVTSRDNGKAYVLFGKKSGWSGLLQLPNLDGTSGFRVEGEVTGGMSVSSAGDINGDGIDDFIIGAPYADPSSKSDAGRSYVIFGKKGAWNGSLRLSDLNGTNGFKLDGEVAGDNSGMSVRGAGDINGDGIDDIIIGAPHGAFSSSGRSYVVFGKKSGWPSNIQLSTLNGANGFKLDGEVPGDCSGYFVGVGDINADGTNDLIIGAPYADLSSKSDAGRTYVIFGKKGGWDETLNLADLNGTNGFKLDGETAGDYSGYSVNSGDINGDGIDDIIIGAPGADPLGRTDAGRSYVVFGKSTGWTNLLSLADLDGTSGFALDGTVDGDCTGYSVSTGDINGDGIDDLIIGAPYTGKYSEGKAYVIFGKTTIWSKTSDITGLNGANGFVVYNSWIMENGNCQVGYSVSSTGDINGDGIDDLIIGAPQLAFNSGVPGYSYVIFGLDTYAPDFRVNKLTISKGQAITLNASYLNITDPVQNSSQLIITIGDVLHGMFDRVIAKGAPITKFSMQRVLDNEIRFVHDGGTTKPSYNVSVDDGTNVVSSTATVIFNTSPTITKNSLTITKGQTVVLGTGNLNASDLEEGAAARTFTVSNIQNGFFDRTSAQGTPITTFTLQEIQNSKIRFVHNGSTNAPIYSVSVSDGKCSTSAVSAAVMFDGVSFPVITANTLAVNQGAPITLSTANLNAADVEHTASQLTFTVSDVLQGYFDRTSLPGTSVTTFTLQEIQNSGIRFVPDGGITAPSYKVSVGDGTSNTATVVGTITFNRPPVLTSNSLSLFQGQAVFLNVNGLNATDTEQDASELIFTASDILHGSFDRVFATGIAIEKFSLQEIKNGEIRFVHDGSANDPSYDISVSDGRLSTTPVTASITCNKTPVLAVNTFTIPQGKPIVLSTANLDASDDKQAATELTFTVSNVLHGIFDRVSVLGTAITSFTLQEIKNGAIRFVHDNSTTVPSFSISISDGSTATLPAASTITFNKTPVLMANVITVPQGKPIILSTANLYASDSEQSASQIIFTVSDVSYGFFDRVSAEGIAITNFTRQEILDGKIRFVHDGSLNIPSYKVSVSDGSTNTSPVAATVVLNKIPKLTANALCIMQGQTAILTTNNFNAIDSEQQASELTFAITNVLYGYFDRTSAQGTAITSFTLQEVLNGEIRFVHDNSTDAPSYNVAVSDGSTSTVPAAAAIVFNDNTPVIVVNAITIGQGQTLVLSSSNLNAIDAEQPASAITITVSSVQHGIFYRGSASSTAITNFTMQEIMDGNIKFKHDGSSTAPSYKVVVTDGITSTPTPIAATVTFSNTPVLTANTLSIAQGKTLVLNTSNLNASDVEQSAQELIFTISSIQRGIFYRGTDAGTSITNFTMQEILDGNIKFKHDGSSTAPSYKVVVSDGITSTAAPSTATITFNKTPVLTVNTLNIVQGQALVLGTSNLNASDAEQTAQQIIFSVSNILHGRFERTSALGFAITTFTLKEIQDGKIQFVHDDSTVAPSYHVEVSDGLTTSASSAVAVTFEGAPINVAPILKSNTLNIGQGQTLVLSTDNLDASDLEQTTAELVFTVSNVQNGIFYRGIAANAPITSFTLQEIIAGDIKFKHDGSSYIPTYSVSLSDGKNDVPEVSAVTTLDRMPTFIANELTIYQGQTLVLGINNLSASDFEQSEAELIFNVSNIQHGIFYRGTAPDTEITNFTLQEIIDGGVYFKHDNSVTPPSYSISVNDKTSSTSLVQAMITFTLHTPKLEAAIFDVRSNEQTIVTPAMLRASDIMDDAAKIEFIIEAIQEGTFVDLDNPGVSVFRFAQDRVAKGKIAFVSNSDKPPQFTVAATDGISTSDAVPAIINNLTQNKNSAVNLTNVGNIVGIGSGAVGTVATVIGVVALIKKNYDKKNGSKGNMKNLDVDENSKTLQQGTKNIGADTGDKSSGFFGNNSRGAMKIKIASKEKTVGVINNPVADRM